MELTLIPRSEFERMRRSEIPRDDRLALLADMARVNALVAVKRAGSGHLGSSLSAMDIVVHMLEEELNTAQLGWDHPDRDVYFSSKGHDVPGLYAVLHSLGVIPTERLLRLRRLGGLDGHPDVGVPGIEANSGSLGMGISKGRGIAWAKRHLGRGGRVVVMVGDGELQEGQNWEALQAGAHEAMGNLIVIVDRNELQSDKPTEVILALGNLEEKVRRFGWYVDVCDGHDHVELRETFEDFLSDHDRPKLLIARTIKGKGVSFMEHPRALADGGGTYRWHAGAPDDEAFGRAFEELTARIGERLAAHGLGELALEHVPPLEAETATSLEGEPASGAGAPRPKLKETAEYVAEAYGEALLELAESHPELIVLDADLASDCRVRGFELRYPDRFVEVGIAEQDMVSMAAGLARHGLLPVVNSFASFLASRANEQIYNAASEGARIVYACHYAGLIPAGPGKSHQSLRDASLLGALPNVAVVHPANSVETKAVVSWAVGEATESVAIRLAIGPSPRRIELPGDWRLAVGRGTELVPGADAVALAYGPVMLNETLTAADALRGRGIRLAVVDMPWLNRIDRTWLDEVVAPFEHVFVVEDHSPVGALGDFLRRELQREVTVFGVEGWPACGTPVEALRFHGLDGASLADRIASALR
ncbi:MAG TPA: transketolase C-terminal domain-containing protein [Gaiellaceae bacterium]|nr:transketolase C-terminal domain-containing protein [Gaiellaceae bacterium]